VKAKTVLEREQQIILREVTLATSDMRSAQLRYESAVLEAIDLGVGASAIGRAAGLSEAAIRGFVSRRRRESA
jgi:hypothetical protein